MLGKVSKTKLIIFGEFSVKGGGDPPSVKMINFFNEKKKNPGRRCAKLSLL